MFIHLNLCSCFCPFWMPLISFWRAFGSFERPKPSNYQIFKLPSSSTCFLIPNFVGVYSWNPPLWGGGGGAENNLGMAEKWSFILFPRFFQNVLKLQQKANVSIGQRQKIKIFQDIAFKERWQKNHQILRIYTHAQHVTVRRELATIVFLRSSTYFLLPNRSFSVIWKQKQKWSFYPGS